MSVGLLMITHGEIGHALHSAATSVIGSSPLRTGIVPVAEQDDPDELIPQVVAQLKTLDSGDGVLVLTDMYGSTPSNIACALKPYHVSILAGVNLPMLIRILNYPAASLTELTDKAIEAATEGIVQCKLESSRHAAS